MIAPDSCTILLACGDIPYNFFVKGKKGDKPVPLYNMYFDSLPRDKVGQTHILDIVASELFAADANGKCYDRERQAMNFSEDPNLKLLYDRIFIKKDPSIVVVPTIQGTALIDAFSELKKAEEKVTSYLNTLPEDDKTKKKTQEIKKQFKDLKKTLGIDRGEKIIASYLYDHHNPTFFVSDDRKGRQQAVAAGERNNHGCIYVDNTLGFLTKLKAAGVFDKFGLNEWVTPDMLHNTMYITRRESIPNTNMDAQFRAIEGRNSKFACPVQPEVFFRS